MNLSSFFFFKYKKLNKSNKNNRIKSQTQSSRPSIDVKEATLLSLFSNESQKVKKNCHNYKNHIIEGQTNEKKKNNEKQNKK